ncbi:MAG: hypothetical protein UHZ01_01430 [Prevotella sp.]|nr:hypothetical protein [Prevotella sp.]
MNRLFLILISLFIITSCHESIEERAKREATEYTLKNCPVLVSKGVFNDSIVFAENTKTLCYFYSVEDTTKKTRENIIKEKENIRVEIVRGIINSTSQKAYKDAGFSFEYIYYPIRDAGDIMLKITVTPDDYNKKQR